MSQTDSMNVSEDNTEAFESKTDGGDETLARLDDERANRKLDDDILMLAQAAANMADDIKGEKPIILNIGAKTSYCDYFVVSSAPSERQVMAISNSIETTFRKAGYKPIGVEGKGDGNWVLLDFGDFVVHTFLSGAREYYDLEGFWVDAPRIPFDPEAGARRAKELEAEGERLAAERNEESF
ncbi:MAG: ribosome silencing factor [Deltaproteobacteria bacterium]|nr:ribosome silencing factor [Deltaproteobacteria bacterium]